MPSNLSKSVRPKQVHEFVLTRLEQRRVKVLLNRATYLLILQEIVKTDNIFADFERIEHTELRLPGPSVKPSELAASCTAQLPNLSRNTHLSPIRVVPTRLPDGKVVIFLFKILKPLLMIPALRFVHLPLHDLLHGENLIPFVNVDIHATAATH